MANPYHSVTDLLIQAYFAIEGDSPDDDVLRDGIDMLITATARTARATRTAEIIAFPSSEKKSLLRRRRNTLAENIAGSCPEV
jgi:hypothetical protein